MSNIFIDAMYNYGREKALELREDAPNLTDTEIIDQEDFVPNWHEGLQILNAVVKFEEQVYRVIQAHDSTGNWYWNPKLSPALFSICHTKNPYKAKSWIAPSGTSGMYELGDCYIDNEGIIWRQIYDGDNVYDAETLPERWEQVNLYAEIEEQDGQLETVVENDNNENNNSEQSNENEIINNNEEINEYPEWVQPTGAHDAYNVDDKVSYNNKHWINIIPANTYAPGIYGWNEIEE